MDTFKHLDLSAIPEDPNVNSKIQRLQETDRWRAEKSQSTPLDFKVVSIESDDQLQSDQSTKCAEPFQYVMQIEAANTSWQGQFHLKDLIELARNLTKTFPIEAGKVGKHKRILPIPPERPRKSILRAGYSKKVTQDTLIQVKAYIDSLMTMPKYILQSRLVVDFLLQSFNTTPTPKSPPSPCASAAGDLSSCFESSSTRSSSVSEKASVIWIKLKFESGVFMVGASPEKGFEVFQRQVEKKLQHIHDEKIQVPVGYVYKDRMGDEIVVKDDEDFQIACTLFPQNLAIFPLESE